MTRRSTLLSPQTHDGTTQRGRSLPALDPDYVSIDERSNAELLAFVQVLAAELRFFAAEEDDDEPRATGTWQAFAKGDGVSTADMVEYIAEPERFADDRARWLGRPHFALLLTFVELLGHARAQLNQLTGRHLDYFYRDVLRMEPLPARPDRVAVAFRLASQVSRVVLPAGTALDAGRDSSGLTRIYRTERALTVSRAALAELRSVFVHRRVTGISDVRDDLDLTADEAFEGTLRIALGEPGPGDPLPPWREEAIDAGFFRALRGPLAVASASEGLYLAHHELRALMRLVRRRDAGHEWARINDLLGVTDPEDPRDFVANLESRVGELEFQEDGLPQVDDVDDLYRYRFEPDVRDYIDDRLGVIGYDDFVEAMALKLLVDAEWAEINRLLERAGQRKRASHTWRFPADGFDPTAFADNLALALDGDLPAWPWQVPSIYEYEARLRDLEAHLSMSIERVERLAAFGGDIEGDHKAESHDWGDVDRILTDAHREQVHAARRAILDDIRGARDDRAVFDELVTFVLTRPNPAPETPIPWDEARQILIDNRYLEDAELGVLDRFRAELEAPAEGPAAEIPEAALRTHDWPEVYCVLELAQRHVEAMPEPVARKSEWRNLYAYEDARMQRDDPDASPRWETFGGLPPAAEQPPAPALGWALRSPILSLSQGTRTLTLTLGFAAEGLDDEALQLRHDAFLRAFDPPLDQESQLPAALADAWIIQVSTAEGWVELALETAELATGVSGDDYWSVRGVPRPGAENRPALQLELIVDGTHDPIAPLPGMEHPTLRVLLRPRWDDEAEEWTTQLDPFEPLRLAAAHVHVEVASMTELTLQQDGRALDARKPFEPFGARPMSGSRLYLSHPELVRARLETLRFDIDWMGLPASLASHYANYPGSIQGSSFTADIALLDRNLEAKLSEEAELFADNPTTGDTMTERHLEVDDVPAALPQGVPYTREPDLSAADDLSAARRCLYFELRGDFGHTTYPALAATKAAELSVQIAKDLIDDSNPVSDYQVNAPYTPRIKQMRVGYTTSIEIDLTSPGDAGPDRLLHLHPFGETVVTADEPDLLPRYADAGELYLGLRGVEPPQRLSLLVQLAEGSSDPDLERAPVSWSCLDGDRWRDVDVLHDGTRGLINSGIVELALPGVAPSARLPGGLYWVRVAIPHSPTSVCDAIDIRAQAVTALFEDHGNAADHYARPLPVGSIARLVEPDARIAEVQQPFTSSGGTTPEQSDKLRTRVSERLRHKQRALSPWDYERLVLQRFGHIFKVKCLRAVSAPGRVDVLVIPDIREALPGDALAPKASSDLLADIQAYLRERTPATASVRVRNPRYVPVMVRLGVRFAPGVDQGYARTRLNEDLVRFLSPWAYDEGAELTIGGRIYATSILDFIDRRDYVAHAVDIKLFRGVGKGDFALIPVTDDYHVAAEGPDQVLVAAREHVIDVIPELGYQQELFTGIGYMKLELDFIVGE